MYLIIYRLGVPGGLRPVHGSTTVRNSKSLGALRDFEPILFEGVSIPRTLDNSGGRWYVSIIVCHHGCCFMGRAASGVMEWLLLLSWLSWLESIVFCPS